MRHERPKQCASKSCALLRQNRRRILQARTKRRDSCRSCERSRVQREAHLTGWEARATKPRTVLSTIRHTRVMSFNTFGHLFRVTTFGESHGPAIGCVIDGCPPRIPLTEADIQPYLDRRRPGQSRYTTQRQEPDAVKILSGVFTDEQSGAQVTTGTPIALLIDNVDQRSQGLFRDQRQVPSGPRRLHL